MDEILLIFAWSVKSQVRAQPPILQLCMVLPRFVRWFIQPLWFLLLIDLAKNGTKFSIDKGVGQKSNKELTLEIFKGV